MCFSMFNFFTTDRRRRLAYFFFLTLWTYIYSLYLDMYVVHIWTVLLFNYINFCDATLVGGVVFTWQAWLLLSLLNKGALRWGTKKDKPLFNIGLPFLLRYLGLRRETAVTPVFLSCTFKPNNQCRISLQEKQSIFFLNLKERQVRWSYLWVQNTLSLETFPF